MTSLHGTPPGSIILLISGLRPPCDASRCHFPLALACYSFVPTGFPAGRYCIGDRGAQFRTHPPHPVRAPPNRVGRRDLEISSSRATRVFSTRVGRPEFLYNIAGRRCLEINSSRATRAFFNSRRPTPVFVQQRRPTLLENKLESGDSSLFSTRVARPEFLLVQGQVAIAVCGAWPCDLRCEHACR